MGCRVQGAGCRVQGVGVGGRGGGGLGCWQLAFTSLSWRMMSSSDPVLSDAAPTPPTAVPAALTCEKFQVRLWAEAHPQPPWYNLHNHATMTCAPKHTQKSTNEYYEVPVRGVMNESRASFKGVTERGN